ncbi:vitamin K epoxide reductase family protein [Effusibacillus consociatus]|uniref:Vitamin K epoxide reductase family protein n=1 Tax=Effusibacillus consociatus TaxID=1117041 RepID=A0ABV9PZ52_9BACL
MMRKKSLVLIIQGLAVVGIVISFYLFLSKLSSQFFCPVGDCQTVNNSEFAQIGPIPVSLMGVFFYIAISVLLEIKKRLDKRVFELVVRSVLIVGLLFSLYLTVVELAVLHAVCMWCVLSFFLVILMNLLYWIDAIKKRLLISDNAKRMSELL